MRTVRAKAEVHKVHVPGGFWVNRIFGRPVSRHRTKETVIQRLRQIARKRRSEH